MTRWALGSWVQFISQGLGVAQTVDGRSSITLLNTLGKILSEKSQPGLVSVRCPGLSQTHIHSALSMLVFPETLENQRDDVVSADSAAGARIFQLL